tara:strand:+ start:95 stop:388 length:294 start_codon:yes stop_codon:yes gene_type:complete
MAFRLPGWSPFKKEKRFEGPRDKEKKEGEEVKDPGPATRPKEPGEGEPKGGTAPLPGLSRGFINKMLKQFNKGAGAAKKQSNIMQKMLEKKGYKFKK